MSNVTQEQADLHLLIKDIYSTHDPLLHITTVADRAKLVNALIAAGYVKLPEPEIEWGAASKWGQHAAHSREGAEVNIDLHRSCGENAKLVKRVAAVAPGPWEWVEES